MLIENLPNCVCGSHDYLGGGGHSSSYMHSQGFTCNSCRRIAYYMNGYYCSVLIYIDEKKESEKDNPTEADNWLNLVVIPTWRDYKERREAAKKLIADRFMRYARVEIGLPYDEGTDVPSYNAMTPEQQHIWGDFWRGMEHHPKMKTPPGFETPLIPPKMPQSVHAAFVVSRVREGDSQWDWTPVDRAQSQALPVPPDPILVKHNIYWGEVFAAVRRATGVPFTPVVIPNQYMGNTHNEPWYEFVVGDCTIIAGPRKRVDEIAIVSPHRPIDVEAFRTGFRVVEMNNTFGTREHGFYVHCWEKETLINRLVAMVEWAQSPANV